MGLWDSRDKGQEKIKTESGRYISSSYKQDLYPGERDQKGGGQLLSAPSSWSGQEEWPISATPASYG